MYSRTTTYFTALVRVIFSTPVKVKVMSCSEPVKVETSKTSDVAKGEPVGTDEVPKVPV